MPVLVSFTHLPIVGIVDLGPGITQRRAAKVLREALLHRLVAKGLHRIPGTGALATWRRSLQVRR